MTERVYIPEMSKEDVANRAERIKPCYRFGDVLKYIEPVDLYTTAFTWSPNPAENAEGLRPLNDITTYHSYGYYGFFKPSISEVLRQIPADIVDKVVAFEIIKSPENSDDLNANIEALNAGYHVATTRLYIR